MENRRKENVEDFPISSIYKEYIMAGGTIAFLIIMVGILLLGITIFLLGTIFLIIRVLKRHSNMKKEKKLTMPIVLMVLGMIIISIPVILFFMQRASNNSYEEGYKDTGKMLYWGENVGGYKNCFKMDGEQYVGLEIDGKNTSSPKGKAVANIETKKSSLSDRIFGSNDAETLYNLKNDSGYRVLTDGSYYYCSLSNVKNIIKYYGDMVHYNYYAFYGKNPKIKISNANKITIDSEVISEVLSLSHKNKNEIKTGFHLATVVYKSKDGIFEGDLYFIKKANKLYYSYDSDYDENGDYVYSCILLPENLSNYFNNKLNF